MVDENGVPTGMLHERARHLVYDILTKYTKEQLKQFILDYQKDLLSTGLTTVQTTTSSCGTPLSMTFWPPMRNWTKRAS